MKNIDPVFPNVEIAAGNGNITEPSIQLQDPDIAVTKGRPSKLKSNKRSFIYKGIRAHMSAGLRIFGFGYQNFKSFTRYTLGLESYPCPCPWTQTQTRIRAQQV